MTAAAPSLVCGHAECVVGLPCKRMRPTCGNEWCDMHLRSIVQMNDFIARCAAASYDDLLLIAAEYPDLYERHFSAICTARRAPVTRLGVR